MGLQETLDDILRQPGDLPGASRGRNFGVKPKLWDTRVKLGGQERSSVNELADIKVCSLLPFKIPILIAASPSRSPLCMSREGQQSP